jgi:uncharacterized protein YkwD
MPARRSSRHQAVRRHGRLRPVLGVIATGVVVATLSFVTTTTAARILLASGATTVTGTACPSSDPASPAACPTAAPAANPGIQAAAPALPASAGPATAGSRTGGRRTSGPPAAGSATAEPRPSTATAQPPDRPTPTSTPSVTESDSAEKQVLTSINRARAEAGLPGYTITAGLHRSAGRHNEVMAAGCGLSHQCPGEPPLGERESDAGVHWTSAGENIGEGGPVPDSPEAIAQMALVLTKDMLRERPPDDGHRRNLLSGTFRHIGIAIFRDRHGTVWMTQDFSN